MNSRTTWCGLVVITAALAAMAGVAATCAGPDPVPRAARSPALPESCHAAPAPPASATGMRSVVPPAPPAGGLRADAVAAREPHVSTVREVQALQRRGDTDSRRQLVGIARDPALASALRVAALRALGDLPDASVDALATLWSTACDERPDVEALATTAARAFGRAMQGLAPDDARAVAGRARLADALHRATSAARQRLLLLALAHAGHPDLTNEALRFLDAGDARVRAAAAVALAADVGGEQIAREIAATTADPEVRRILLRRLRQHTS